MGTWTAVRDGAPLQLRAWASGLGRAGFTLLDDVSGDVVEPIDETADSATYELDAERNWPLRLTATASSSPSGKVRIWHEVRQPSDGEIQPCFDDPTGEPTNGPEPFEPVELGELNIGEGDEYAIRIICLEQDP